VEDKHGHLTPNIEVGHAALLFDPRSEFNEQLGANSDKVKKPMRETPGLATSPRASEAQVIAAMKEFQDRPSPVRSGLHVRRILPRIAPIPTTLTSIPSLAAPHSNTLQIGLRFTASDATGNGQDIAAERPDTKRQMLNADHPHTPNQTPA